MKKLRFIFLLLMLSSYINSSILPYLFQTSEMAIALQEKEEKTEKEEKECDDKTEKEEKEVKEWEELFQNHLMAFSSVFYQKSSDFIPHQIPLFLESLHDREIPSPPPDLSVERTSFRS